MVSCLTHTCGVSLARSWTAPADLTPWILGLGLCLLVLGMACPSSAFGGGEGPRKVRAPILAGSWYEGSASSLARSVDGYLQGEDRPEVPLPSGAEEARAWAAEGRVPAALIVPHAGHVYSGECAGSAFRLVQGARVNRVLLLGPSHRAYLQGAALPEETAFATPLGEVPLDREAIQTLAGEPGFSILPKAHAQEHSLEIELPFLQRALAPGFTLVPVVIGSLDDSTAAQVARGIGRLWQKGSLLVISSDFTHYGRNFDYLPFRERVAEQLEHLDGGAIKEILQGDASGFAEYCRSTGATICGAGPIRILLRAESGRHLIPRWVDYYRSGDQTGDWDNSVSYAAIAFFPAQPAAPAAPEAPAALSSEEQSFLLTLARDTVEALVGGRPLPDEDTPARFPADSPLRERRGVFVTLTTKPRGELRGCIGNIEGDLPLTAGVVQNAVAAASRDPRFPPVSRSEAARLHLEISVLTPLRKVSGPEEIVIGRDGVVLEKNGHRAVFLPQVAPEQGWGVPEMLTNLAIKARLRPDDWKSGAAFYTFQAQVFEETDRSGEDGHGR